MAWWRGELSWSHAHKKTNGHSVCANIVCGVRGGDREKRPSISFTEIHEQLVADQQYPETMGWFYDSNPQLRVPV